MIDLLKKWLGGSVSWEAEKRLRKQAETDTFLAEAMEGYDQFPAVNHSEKLTALQNRLKQKNNIQATKTKSYVSRAIAASLALLLSAGLFFLVKNPLQNQAPLSDISSQEKYTGTTDAATESFSYSKSAPLAEQEQSNTVISETSTAIEKKRTKKKEVARQQKERKSKPTLPLQSTKAKKPIKIQETASSTAVLAQTSEDQPAKEQASPIIEESQAAITMLDQRTETIAKMEEAATIEKENTEPAAIIDKEITEPAIIAAQLPATKETTSDRLLESSDDNKRTRTVPSMGKKIKPQLATPVGGMKKFHRYIKKNIKYPTISTRTTGNVLPLTGSVLLNFSVTNNGEVTDIKVVKGINEAYNQEAIRLLREGPKWISNGTSKGEFEVVFE